MKGGNRKREEDGWVMEKIALSKTLLTGVERMGCLLSLVPGSEVAGPWWKLSWWVPIFRTWDWIKDVKTAIFRDSHIAKTSFGVQLQNNQYPGQPSWVPKNWCFWTVVLEKTLESSLDRKKIQKVHPKGNQSWIFIGRAGVEAETPILWPPDAKNWLIGKDPDAGKDWRQEEKGMTEDEMVGWHHQLDGHEFD